MTIDPRALPFAAPALGRRLASALPATPGAGSVATVLLDTHGGPPQSGVKDENGYAWINAINPVYVNNFEIFPSSSNAAPGVRGGAINGVGTITHPAIVTTSIREMARRTRFATGTGAGTFAGYRQAPSGEYFCFRGDAAGRGGFFATFIFGLAADATGAQCFVGLGGFTDLGGDASALTNIIGMGFDAADLTGGNWFLLRNDASGTATKVDLGSGAKRSDLSLLELQLSCKPNDSVIWARVVNRSTGVVVLDWTSYSTDLPVSTTLLGPHCQPRNGALTTDIQIEHAATEIKTTYAAVI